VIPATLLHSFKYGANTHNVYRCNKGEGLPRHEHDFAHATVCHAGKVVIRKEGIEREFAPESGAVVLRANEWHELEALEDGTAFENIFSI